MLDDGDLAAAALNARPMLSHWKDRQETDAKIDGALSAAGRNSEAHCHAVASLGEGWVGQEAQTIGLYSALVAKSFREVFSIAANHDGDSDSTAAIAGQFYGVRYVWISLTWRIRSVSALE